MTLAEIRAAIAALETERAGIVAASEARFADAEDTTEVRGGFLLGEDGEPSTDPDPFVGLTNDEAVRMAEMDGEQVQLDARLARAERVERAVQAGNTAPSLPNISIGTEDAHDYERARTASGEDLRGMVRTAIENITTGESERQSILDTVTGIERNGGREARAVAQYVIAHSSDAYRSMFYKHMTGQSHGWTDSERQAFEWARESRATITASSGLSFPVNIDPTFTPTNDVAVHPFRQLATVRSGTAPTHHVNTRGGASFAMNTDGTEVAADGTPTVSNVQIDAQLMDGVVTWTITSEEDMQSLEAELRVAIAEEVAATEAQQFTTGTGVAPQVEGILDGTTITRVSTATTAVLVEDDLIGAYNAIGARWRPNLSWMGSIPTFNAMRKFESTGGGRTGVAQTITESGTMQLMGRPYLENSLMDGPTGVSTFTAGDDVLVLGDIAAAFRIYDRVGVSVEGIPHMFGANQRPLGTRGAYIRKRFGAGIVNPAAARIVDIA